MKTNDSIGFAATVVASIALIPQVHKVYVTKSAKDLSYPMIFLIMVAATLWFAHGWVRKDIPLMASSGIKVAVVVVLFALKNKYDHTQDQ